MKEYLPIEKKKGVFRWLASPSSGAWLSQALSNPMEVLIDHAHCERKAAGAALQFMFRYLCDRGLAEALSPLVREELEHFEKVLSLIKSRGRYLEPLPAPPYGNLLAKQIRKIEPQRMLDSFLVAGMIEARSHERMSLLAEHSDDNEIRTLYSELVHSEARHVYLYWNLAEERYSHQDIILRLKEIAICESDILSELHCNPRMHS